MHFESSNARYNRISKSAFKNESVIHDCRPFLSSLTLLAHLNRVHFLKMYFLFLYIHLNLLFIEAELIPSYPFYEGEKSIHARRMF